MLIPRKKITIKSTIEPSQIEKNLEEIIGLEQYTQSFCTRKTGPVAKN